MPVVTNLATAFDEVRRLGALFEASRSFYLSSSYQEAEARKDFVDKFLDALGWDVDHDEQTNPFEQEVKVERGVAMGLAQRRADYALFVAPNFRDPRLLVEAKKPSIELAAADAYFQAVRYGWNKQNPIVVLTNFAEVHVLDCRFQPNIDTVLERCVRKFAIGDLGDRDHFAKLYWLMSREAVAGGSLQRFADALPRPRSRSGRRRSPTGVYQRIDESFLQELDEHRLVLARAFKARHPELDGEVLTEITQRTIDRLVFMRFLEDKLIEPAHFVSRFGERPAAWHDFVSECRRLDSTYNGVVFKRHSLLDAKDFEVEDAAFSRVCRRLSHLHSPYDFNSIPIHILGSIYERFLGNVIVATEKRARVEPKPSVRKAGGVYYTPDYIVQFIVAQTIGTLIAGKSPAEIARLRIVDIACGSGSFLLAAFDALLQHYARYYNDHPRKARKGDCVERDGVLHVSLEKRREILLNNIFGVDVDSQAVEVTQLSLYLKLLEEETIASARDYQLRLNAAILPALDNNIVCGNSVIGTDFINGRLFSQADEADLNPMDFRDRFPGVMREGGFDAVVGNPPYVRIQGFPAEQVRYLREHYSSVVGNADLYVSFIERGFKLLKRGGRFGQIVPNKFLKTDYGAGLRRLIGEGRTLAELVDFGANQVFDATTYTCLLFLTNEPQATFRYSRCAADAASLESRSAERRPIDELSAATWNFGDGLEKAIDAKLATHTARLLDLPASMSRGSSTGADDVFLVSARSPKVEGAALRIPLFATDFSRYRFTPGDEWRVVYPYAADGHPRLYPEVEFKRRFPRAFAYLQAHQQTLKRRKQFAAWYGFSAPRNLERHEGAQIAVPLLAERGSCALVPPQFRGKLCPMASGGFTLSIAPECPLCPEYVLGLLNSRLLFWRLRRLSNLFRGGWITCTKQYFGELPIRTIDLGEAGQKAQHDAIVRLVEQLIEARSRAAEGRSDRQRTYFARKCESLDRRIDEVVYDLYGLTADEVQLVEREESAPASGA